MTRNLILSGGPGHDFDATARALVDLAAAEGVDSTVLTDPDAFFGALADEGPDLVTVAALRWSMAQRGDDEARSVHRYHLAPADAERLDRHVRDGGGLLVLHTGVICFDAHPTWRELCGAAWDWERSSHPPCGPVAVRPTARGRTHVLTRGVEAFVVEDEAYGSLDEVDGLDALLTTEHGGRVHPLLWARPVGAGRVVTDLLGHGPSSLTHPTHRTILRRAVRWATGDRP